MDDNEQTDMHAPIISGIPSEVPAATVPPEPDTLTEPDTTEPDTTEPDTLTTMSPPIVVPAPMVPELSPAPLMPPPTPQSDSFHQMFGMNDMLYSMGPNSHHNQINRFISLLDGVVMGGNNIFDRSFNDQGGAKKPCLTSFINGLKKITVTNENVDDNLCCAICQDNFKIDENVIKLPCSDDQTHYYHYETDKEICEGILPWLKDNNTCPVCRTEFPFDESPKKILEENNLENNNSEENNLENSQENNNNSEENNLENSQENNYNSDNDSVQDVDDIMRSILNMMPRPTNASLSADPHENPRPNRIYFRLPPNIIPIYSDDEDPALQAAIQRSLED